MVRIPGRRWRSASGLAVAVMLGGPAVVQAQLLPNAPIRRERPPCVQEPPFYAVVRHQYFGYYPTCWRRFPAGWACPCPNPELPNWKRELEERPLRAEGGGATTGPRDGADDIDRDRDRVRPRRPDGGTGRDEMPGDLRLPEGSLLPEREDATRPSPPPPLDERPEAVPRAPGRGRGAARPRTDILPEPVPAPSPEASAERLDLPPVASGAPEVPPLALPGDGPSPIAEPASDSAPAAPAPAASTPAPGAPLPAPPASAAATTLPTVDDTPAPSPLAPAVQAPARRSLLGGLLNRTRRR